MNSQTEHTVSVLPIYDSTPPPPPPGEQSTRVTKKLAAKTVDEDHAGAKPPLKSVI